MPPDVIDDAGRRASRAASSSSATRASIHDVDTPLGDLPAYEGPPDPPAGHTHEWGADVAEAEAGRRRGPLTGRRLDAAGSTRPARSGARRQRVADPGHRDRRDRDPADDAARRRAAAPADGRSPSRTIARPTVMTGWTSRMIEVMTAGSRGSEIEMHR